MEADGSISEWKSKQGASKKPRITGFRSITGPVTKNDNYAIREHKDAGFRSGTAASIVRCTLPLVCESGLGLRPVKITPGLSPFLLLIEGAGHQKRGCATGNCGVVRVRPANTNVNARTHMQPR